MLFSWLSLSIRPVRQRKTTLSCRTRRSRLLHVEELEGRLTPNAYTVNILGDTSGSASGSGSGTSGDLRYCLNQAIADQQTDTITFSPGTFTNAAQKIIALSSSLVTKPSAFTNTYGQTSFIIGASDNITIDGSLGANTSGITLSGGNATRLFAIEGGGTLEVKNLTLSAGQATRSGGPGFGGAVVVDGTNVTSYFTANDCTFLNNQAIGSAGVSAAGNKASPPFSPVNSGGNGGLGGSDANFGVGGNGGLAPGGSGQPGGFGGGAGSQAGISSNGASGGNAGLGGAIFSSAGNVTLTNDTFTGNTATGGTGGAAAGGVAAGGSGQGLGGAVFVRNGSLTANFVTLSGNTADQGSDVYLLGDGSGDQVLALLTNSILGQNASTTVTDFFTNTNKVARRPTSPIAPTTWSPSTARHPIICRPTHSSPAPTRTSPRPASRTTAAPARRSL